MVCELHFWAKVMQLQNHVANEFGGDLLVRRNGSERVCCLVTCTSLAVCWGVGSSLLQPSTLLLSAAGCTTGYFLWQHSLPACRQPLQTVNFYCPSCCDNSLCGGIGGKLHASAMHNGGMVFPWFFKRTFKAHLKVYLLISLTDWASLTLSLVLKVAKCYSVAWTCEVAASTWESLWRDVVLDVVGRVCWLWLWLISSLVNRLHLIWPAKSPYWTCLWTDFWGYRTQFIVWLISVVQQSLGNARAQLSLWVLLCQPFPLAISQLADVKSTMEGTCFLVKLPPQGSYIIYTQ